jgi:dolichol-phosphate mannosyltransferase
MKPKSILVVIPTYSEVDNLVELTQAIQMSCPTAHVLLVDDASGDGTPEWVRGQPDYEQSLFLIERPGKRGLASAYLSGFQWGLDEGYDVIVQMDADLSHDPASIPDLLFEENKGSDLVLGSRYLDGVRVLNWPLNRLFLSVGAAQYVRWMTRMPFTDPTGGFKCWKRELLEAFDFGDVHSSGYAFQIEMTHTAWRLGAQIAEVPIIFEDRRAGSSKMTGRIAREAVWQVLRLGLKGRGHAV